MALLVCRNCKKVYEVTHETDCPGCSFSFPHSYNFKNSDRFLKRETARVLARRKKSGLEGLVGGLECVIINTEPSRLRSTVRELLDYTGLNFDAAFEDDRAATCVLKTEGSADFLVTSRKGGRNPFLLFNEFPKSRHLPNTRIETFVFSVRDIDRYVEIQKSLGVRFLSARPMRLGGYSFIQTPPSRFTGNSLGFIEWDARRGDYRTPKSERLPWRPEKPAKRYLRSVRELDHAATRVKAEERDAAIIEFLELTNYHFDFAIYVKVFNSITNVARLTAADYAMVFTSGISPYVNDDVSGPTEKFIHNYGPRVHHIAFRTDDIEKVFANLGKDGIEFLIELVGSPREGLKQTFTMPSENSLLVTEYIHRYGKFDGFFTRSNVTLLTGSTARQ
jgi:4-hydroxyphenylpyruvate dioxygenase-like putative hemolysin